MWRSDIYMDHRRLEERRYVTVELLKIFFSEIHHKKSVTIVEMKEKGNVEISTKELAPLRDWCEMKGTYMELTAKGIL